MLIEILSITILLLIIAIYYWYLYNHPTVHLLSKKPSHLLLEIPLEKLAETKLLLQRTNYLDKVLEANDIDCLDIAIQFISVSNEKRYELISKKLNCKMGSSINSEVFKLNLCSTFPLGLASCLLYFPAKNLTATGIINKLKQEFMFSNVVVITLKPSQQSRLRSYGKDLSTRWVVPNNQELTTLLLHPDPVCIFTELLTDQLAREFISPYQTQGGITKEMVFFGREELLAKILNRDLANYLIIGGRQLGKSSFLKKIERYYENDINVQCHYLSLFGNSLLDVLKKEFKLKENDSQSIALEKLGNVEFGKSRLLLIDESDQFIRDEKANNYPLLSFFRGLSELGNCHFIFVGFWDLYYAGIDYQSPIRNFGQSIQIGKLEADACRQLAIEPMKILDIYYESENLVEQILTATGQRANLIAITCNEILEKLKNDQNILKQENITNALNCEAIEIALSGWTKLTDDDEASRLDCIIVYTTIKKGRFNKKSLLEFFNKYNYVCSVSELEDSLKRLELAYIIQRNQKGIYTYCVPLFRKKLLEEDLVVLLKQEMRSLTVN